MTTYGPEEFKLADGKVVVIKSWSHAEIKDLEASLTQFTKEMSLSVDEENIHHMADEIHKRWETLAEDPSNIFLGAFDGERLIGYITLRKPFPDRPWATHIGAFGLLILNNYWSQGLGVKLLDIMEKIAKEHNITRLEAKVRINNHRASNLFMRQKYQIEGKRKHSVLINGKYEDEYYLGKILDNEVPSEKS